MQPFEVFQYCPRCGKPAQVEKSVIPFQCEGCGLKLFFNPTVSVSAFVIMQDGDILLIRRAKDPGKGLLGTIGGFVDAGESAEEGLRREIREEVHLEVARVEFLYSFPNQYHYAGITYPVLDLFFTCWTTSSASARTSNEVLSLVCLPLAKINTQDMAFESMRQALLILKSKNPTA
jgi:ADP-ribose pyrophosphatase YjhB (NUDIX family)